MISDKVYRIYIDPNGEAIYITGDEIDSYSDGRLLPGRIDKSTAMLICYLLNKDFDYIGREGILTIMRIVFGE